MSIDQALISIGSGLIALSCVFAAFFATESWLIARSELAAEPEEPEHSSDAL